MIEPSGCFNLVKGHHHHTATSIWPVPYLPVGSTVNWGVIFDKVIFSLFSLELKNIITLSIHIVEWVNSKEMRGFLILHKKWG